jgi:hypothetical protein
MFLKVTWRNNDGSSLWFLCNGRITNKRTRPNIDHIKVQLLNIVVVLVGVNLVVLVGCYLALVETFFFNKIIEFTTYVAFF